MANIKSLRLLRNKNIFSDYQSAVDGLSDTTFLEDRVDGEIIVSRFNDTDDNPRSVLGVVSVKDDKKTIDVIDTYELDGGNYNMDSFYNRQIMSIVGSAYLYNTQTNKYTFSTVDDLSKYPATDGWTPIGVVVIPASHDVYGTGECAIMSLKAMCCNDPINGSNSNTHTFPTNILTMKWGINNITEQLERYDMVPYVGSNGVVNETVQGTTNESNACIPSDKFTNVVNPYDSDTYYFTTNVIYVPSPYLTYGSRNTAYFQTSSPSSTSNALADFDGRSNTDIILAARGTKDYSSWVLTYNNVVDYPAASCCDMFYTDGTSQGDWYLPACGELGYIMPRFNKINQSITALIDAYGNAVGVQLDSSGGYWTSTQSTDNTTWYIVVYSGSLYRTDGSSNLRIRAFMRVK